MVVEYRAVGGSLVRMYVVLDASVPEVRQIVGMYNSRELAEEHVRIDQTEAGALEIEVHTVLEVLPLGDKRCE